ncbi:MAG TPA: hypothetical protein VNL14_08045 [Candidatus Acidoferrales bacterium]|nr:hypothetical protein [Candidatus Acidoferrales bacterium]
MGYRISRQEQENVCAYCPHFQTYPESKTELQGNCTLHKEWIENADRTTCSEMSTAPLKAPGIYRLVLDPQKGWIYVRREQKIRTRLFLVKGGKKGEVRQRKPA